MIAQAAIRQDNIVYTLPRPARHHTIIRYMVRDLGMIIPIKGEQGFTTDNGIFVNRIQAAKIAIESGQIEKLNNPPELFSEDLW